MVTNTVLVPLYCSACWRVSLKCCFKIPGLCVSLDGKKLVTVGDHIHVCIVSLISNTKEAKRSSQVVRQVVRLLLYMFCHRHCLVLWLLGLGHIIQFMVIPV